MGEMMKILPLHYLVGAVCVMLALHMPAEVEAQSLSKPLQSKKTGQSVQAKSIQSTCFCKISAWDALSNICHPDDNQVAMDLTGVVNTKYGWPRNGAQAAECSRKCSDASNQVNLATLANTECSRGFPNGTVLRAFSALGNCGRWGKYKVVDTIGTLTNTPEVTNTTCTCPNGWLANTTNEDGGVTEDKKCKKFAASNTVTPPPPNGTPVGTWGFMWGNGIYAWGTSANGGAASCVTTVVSPAVCKID